MQRPTNATDLGTLITGTLAPAVGALATGAQQAGAQAQTDAQKAAADKAAADAASATAAQELAQAQTEQQAAATKQAQAQKVQDELNTASTLLSFVPKLSDPNDQTALFNIVGKQVDGLVSDMGMSYDAPPAPSAAPQPGASSGS